MQWKNLTDHVAFLEPRGARDCSGRGHTSVIESGSAISEQFFDKEFDKEFCS